MEASPERFELLLHTFVEHVLCILCNKLLHKTKQNTTVTIKCLNPNEHFDIFSPHLILEVTLRIALFLFIIYLFCNILYQRKYVPVTEDTDLTEIII